MEKKKKVPCMLYAVKRNTPVIGRYRFVQELRNGLYLYENIDYNYKECFKYEEIFPEKRRKPRKIEQE